MLCVDWQNLNADLEVVLCDAQKKFSISVFKDQQLSWESYTRAVKRERDGLQGIFLWMKKHFIFRENKYVLM